jgi:hypothetical protein
MVPAIAGVCHKRADDPTRLSCRHTLPPLCLDRELDVCSLSRLGLDLYRSLPLVHLAWQMSPVRMFRRRQGWLASSFDIDSQAMSAQYTILIVDFKSICT